MHVKQRRFLALLNQLKQSPNTKSLNDLVREAKLDEADRINRSGIRTQLSLLVDRYGLAETKRMLEKVNAVRKISRELGDKFKRNRRLADLVQAIYRRKASEADQLAMSEISEQIQFLVAFPGGMQQVEEILQSRR